jgi:hypothetical protein
LTVASYAASFGHFWDTLVAFYLLFFFQKMNRAWVGLGLALLVMTSMLSYAGSTLVLGLFIPSFSAAILMRRRDAEDSARVVRTMLWSLAGALTAIALFYVQYIPELLPGWVEAETVSGSPEALIEPRFTPLAALAMAVHRLNLFYGPLFGLLVFAALPWVRKRFSHRVAFPLVFGTLFAFLGLNFLRSGLGETHIFQFTKDDLVLLPLAAIVLGALVDTLASRGSWARITALVLLVVWVGWGCYSLAIDVQARFVRLGYPPPTVEPSPNSQVLLR